MDDMKLKAKEAVLQQIMDLMDEREVGGMKSKSPKFAKVEIESSDPMLAEKLKDKMMDVNAEEMPEETADLPAEDDEDLERLKEMYARLK